MKRVYINLKSGILVKEFVDITSRLTGGFEIIADRAKLDARSLLGVYTLDLSKPLTLQIEEDTEENMELLKPYIIGDIPGEV